MTLPGYDFFHIHRVHRRGSGVGLVHRQSIETRSTSVTATSFKCSCCELKFKGICMPLKVVIIYRPPNIALQTKPTCECRIGDVTYVHTFMDYVRYFVNVYCCGMSIIMLRIYFHLLFTFTCCYVTLLSTIYARGVRHRLSYS